MSNLIITALLAFALMPIPSNPHTISSVENHGSWIYMYDQNCNRYKTLSANSVGEVMGYSATFFVSRNGSWIYLFDSEGRRYKTMSYSTVGDVTGVAGNTFTAPAGSWIYTWDKDGKKIKTRAAR